MSMSAYTHPLSLGELTEYWLGECAPELEISIDEHLLACNKCSERLQEIVALAEGVSKLSPTCAGGAVVSASFISSLKAQGVRVREYRLIPNGSVACTIAPTDDLAVAYLSVPLDGVSKLDMVWHDPAANATYRLQDIAFSPAAGEVVFAPDVMYLRTLGTVTQRMQLVSVEDSGERVVGQYTFNHSPYRC